MRSKRIWTKRSNKSPAPMRDWRLFGLLPKVRGTTSTQTPFTASVKDRQVSVGQYVRPNAPLFTLVKPDPIRLRLEVPERMAPWVKNI